VNDFDPNRDADIQRLLELSEAYREPPAHLERMVLDAWRTETAGLESDERLVRESTQDPSPAGVRRRARRWVLPRPRVAIAAPVVALAACCLAFTVMLDQRSDEVRQLRNELVSLRDRPDLPVLSGAAITSFDVDAPFGDARAQVALADDAGVVVVRNAPAPPEGMVWHVWQVDEDDRMKSIGTIDRARDAAFLPLEDIERDQLRRIIVTTEPKVSAPDAPPAEGEIVAEAAA
jgi:hypothetical protein